MSDTTTQTQLVDEDMLCPASASGASWVLSPCDERLAALISQQYNLPDIVAKLLVQRGVKPDEVDAFLNPKLKHSLPDPFMFQDMREGAERLVAAIIAGEKVAIFGDYDVDGATSSALLTQYFRQIGVEPIIYIPDRMKEGYGPNSAAFDTLKQQGASLVITVDCGTLAFEALEHAHELGLEVMVVDHHQAEARLPKAVAVINPNRLDESGACRQLAAVGVCYLLLIATQRLLSEAGFFDSRPKPDLLNLLDIVAVGTVCDVVPLTEFNRSFVSQGLKILSQTQNHGILALREVAGINNAPIKASHLGFALGPRINAGGRVGRASAGVELLTATDRVTANALAKELDGYNAERRAIESQMAEEAMLEAETEVQSASSDGSVIVVAGASWHQGIIGIVASRLKEKFNRPAIVISMEQGSIGKGSARSVTGFDMGAAIISAQSEGLLMKGGGHAMAAGFSIAPEQLDAFRTFMNNRYHCADCHNENVEYQVDATLRASGVTLEAVHLIEQLAPFGSNNPEPLIALQNVRLLKSSIVGTDHVRTLWVDSAIKHPALGGITFRSADSQLGQQLLTHQKRLWDILVTLEIDHWQGQEKINMFVKDAVLKQ